MLRSSSLSTTSISKLQLQIRCQLKNYRTFFGLGDLLSVVGNPKQTLNQITEAKDELEKVKNDLVETGERLKLPPVRTFVKQPNYFNRVYEEQRIKSLLESEATFSVLFGATSTGKTSLLRNVLTSDKYIVLPIDFRISAFSDPKNFYMALSSHLESFFNELSQSVDGFNDEGHNLALGFKHARIDLEKRQEIPTSSDISRLFELLQNALLHYWNWDPNITKDEEKNINERVTITEPKQRITTGSHSLINRRIPVLLLDEVHRLPQLLKDHINTLKVILDGITVLTKQEHVCHVIMATNDPLFVDNVLIKYHVGQHCQIFQLTDPSKGLIKNYLNDHLLPQIPSHLHKHVDDNFDKIYDILGSKYIDWKEYLLQSWLLDGLSVTKSKQAIHAKIQIQSFLNDFNDSNSIKLINDLINDDKPLDVYIARNKYGKVLIDSSLERKITDVHWGPILGQCYSFNSNNISIDGRMSIHENDLPINPILPSSPVLKWAMKEIVKQSKIED